MDAFRRVLVNNSDIDTELPYFVGVQSLENHSINICLHVRGFLIHHLHFATKTAGLTS
jgi:hypothetical protein